MELGNMAFGCSRGKFPIERTGEFETPLYYLIQEACGEKSGYPEFENDTFVLRPYYWGDCTCGFDDAAIEWEKTHPHKPNCYQNRVKDELIEDYGFTKTSWGGLDGPKRMSYDKKGKIEDRVRKKWCIRLGLEFPRGCAVHCTCGREEERMEWLSKNGHSEDCPIVLDNFHHKPTGFGIQWYKYPLRDSYMNMDIGAEEFRRIIKDCLKSLQ